MKLLPAFRSSSSAGRQSCAACGGGGEAKAGGPALRSFGGERNTPKGLLNKVTPIKIWVYDAKTLKLIEGSPYDSKNKASLALGISTRVIDYFLDKDKAEGVKGNYIYSRPLNDKEIKNLLEFSKNLELGNKREVYAYDAYTLDLINNSPFSSIQDAADYFKVNYRTISRHLNTKLAAMQDKMLVY